MNDHDLARHFLDFLRDGKAPWRYPHNRLPEFLPLFGKFFNDEPRSEAEADYAEVDAIVKATSARISHHWRTKKPKYLRFPEDRIILPPRSYFQDDAQYWASVIHELVHWLEWRTNWYGSLDQNELAAESATGMMESFCCLPHDTENGTINKWLPAWTKGIEANPSYLFDAVAQAERSVNYLLDLWRRKEAE